MFSPTLRRWTRMPVAVTVSMVLALTSLVSLTPSSAGAATSLTALVYGPSLYSGATSLEVVDLQALGYSVTIASDAQWAAMTTADFSAYGLLVIGDPRCNDIFSGTLDSLAAVWTPAVTGNVVVFGTDPSFHAGSHSGAATFESHALAFAGAEAGATGLYLSLSCSGNDSQPVLDALAPGMTVGSGSYSDNITDVTAAGAATLNITGADLTGWNSSVHEYIDQWPANYTPLGIVQSSNGCASLITTPGGVTGCPYILARGATYGAVHNLSVSRSGTALTATWQAGSTAGPFLCTLLYGLDTPSSFTARTSTTSCTFYGLSPSTPYGVRVTTSGGSGGSASAWSSPVKSTITCVRGSSVRHITGYAPRCPAGYHQRH